MWQPEGEARLAQEAWVFALKTVSDCMRLPHTGAGSLPPSESLLVNITHT